MFGERPRFAGLRSSGTGNATGRLWQSRWPGFTFKLFTPEYSKRVYSVSPVTAGHRSVTGGSTLAGTAWQGRSPGPPGVASAQAAQPEASIFFSES